MNWYKSLNRDLRICLWASVGIGSLLALGNLMQSNDAARSIEAVLSQYDALPSGPGLSQRLQVIDTSRCPGDFREAHQRLCEAVAQFEEQIASEPKDFGEGVTMGFMNSLMGERDGGYRRMAELHEAYRRQMTAANAEVRAIAARYGAKVYR